MRDNSITLTVSETVKLLSFCATMDGFLMGKGIQDDWVFENLISCSDLLAKKLAGDGNERPSNQN
jgi:hypothetical protein